MVTDVSTSPPPPKVQDDVLQIDRLSVEFHTDRGWTRVVDNVSLNVPIARRSAWWGSPDRVRPSPRSRRWDCCRHAERG